ncbi:MAG: hypothetical protein HN736_15820 [Anaerolineae bacterium]|jgi:hypothetical protein|nr:hypothetical protein [Anaerolineae bacterium]MBT4309549.1 hypothetical protein [Anaerolineae bacterium]MBT4458848.1 hypothetical protein [Anaerolineae bacterium]MBT4842634.1 hypothetical protein [Anaerolineae bacterium]MBT6059915.1 hypothetical protein [Anaerolineae bacterium]
MNIYLVVLLLIIIIVFANLLMFAAVRGSKGMKFDWLNTSKTNLGQPFKKEDDQLNELRRRVKELDDQPDQSD